MSLPRVADLPRQGDDTFLAMLPYATFPVGQVVLSGLIVVALRDRSAYVRFHALQVWFTHLTLLLAVVVYAIVQIGRVAASAQPPATASEQIPVHLSVFGGILLLSHVYAAMGALRTYQGADFVTPGVGYLARRWL